MERDALNTAVTAAVTTGVDHGWRGIGVIPRSGLRLKGAYARFDATRAFDLEAAQTPEAESLCIAGL
ncbi:MAG: hydrogenase formation protein HypD, partial [Acidimicrobiia bacterium]